ncbi:2-polyprenyl-6-methoxyphenol hydroxylase-like FAD-dependent oxidoreductase [Promicromonospora sp. AC04]|uniref:FAD-dependent monooxygenase n=1 Tax=Promicromonospora sp. AC04 TaxID=2135723 RepID=UPI000D3D0715|nr:FAD-dependent monooxygenase [Promicromonospora sp. AC04]PUB26282.1 2-polyprenyl-6-methoxyphenol hydroxylase-like FAD-dependent oxidoreductase [Promicromonospora sp. AC04]
MSNSTAIVVGAGIGGLTAAYALQRNGWQVRLYEQAPAIAPVGAAIGIAPNAVKALDHLGLGAALRDRGLRQEALEIRLRRGARVGRLPASGLEHRYGASFYALHRAELHGLLMDGLDRDILHTGHRAEAIGGGPGAATVTLRTAHGTTTETADLVVAADGVGSRLRAALLPDYPGPTYAGYTVWRGIVPAERAEPLGVPPVLSETWGSGARFGVAPINDGQVYWFACESAPEHTRFEHDLGALAARFQGWHDPVPGLLAATPAETLLRHDVYYLKERLPGFVRGHVALLGDAAHAVTPDIGQGACLAIEDAVTLAAAIEDSGIDAGLRAYDTLRRPRTEGMARASGRIGRVLQTRNPAAAWLRNAIASAAPTALLMRSAGAALTWDPPLGARATRVR